MATRFVLVITSEDVEDHVVENLFISVEEADTYARTLQNSPVSSWNVFAAEIPDAILVGAENPFGDQPDAILACANNPFGDQEA